MGTRAVFVRNGPDRVAGGDKGNPNRIFQLPPVVDRGCVRFVVGVTLVWAVKRGNQAEVSGTTLSALVFGAVPISLVHGPMGGCTGSAMAASCLTREKQGTFLLGPFAAPFAGECEGRLSWLRGTEPLWHWALAQENLPVSSQVRTRSGRVRGAPGMMWEKDWMGKV